MAIVSAGYDGTVDETQFAQLLNRYSIVGPDDFDATNVAGDRMVSISDGKALGPGTTDTATDLGTFQFAAASGTRYDMVVLRRDWQPPGGSTSIAIITGGSTKALPTRNNNPGVIDDQPLYLQRIDGNLLGERTDLRVWGPVSGMIAADPLATSYLAIPGAVVRVGRATFTYEPQGNGVFGWSKRASQSGTYSVATTSAAPNRPNYISLEPGLFTVSPNVQLSWQSQSGQPPRMRTYDVGSAGFGVNVMSDVGNVSGVVHWRASQE